MIDASALARALQSQGLTAWAECVGDQLRRLHDSPHGDWQRWQAALDSLPVFDGGQVDCTDGALHLLPASGQSAQQAQQLRDALMQLHPWRKGPYMVGSTLIDTEWRSDWKWDRLRPHIEPLQDRLVLDVGCGNGYHCWRMALEGARHVIGIDPTLVFLAQFQAIRSLVAGLTPSLADRVDLVPVGMEQLPPGLAAFDSVFSMGVLYHRRSPVDHLLELRGALRPGGQLILETLVIDGDGQRLLLPPDRYAKMRNVWFIPSAAMLETWLARAGYSNVCTVDVTATSVEEQRSTDWMRFESLADFLDPADSRFTIEGHPAPKRAVLIATA
ncbi:MAG: tRNA 5-methoxyuridine(34)/uridine 5-oxyacetic acid(34) synthase CmoB [Gammaproteobacteria bacterium]|nr:tRNA 5-methoxyuridine(34)/uridine 5-oxyacetic acid(34) synthase CmoB [Gammaproteobacteria bacterium]